MKKFRTNDGISCQKYCHLQSRLADIWGMVLILSILSIILAICFMNIYWAVSGILGLMFCSVIKCITNQIFEYIKTIYNPHEEQRLINIHTDQMKKYGESIVDGIYINDLNKTNKL